MTIVIAFKQPSEMTNSISGYYPCQSKWNFSNFAEAMPDNGFLAFPVEQFDHYRCHCPSFYCHSLPYGVCYWKE